jgi:hypothetical protein
MTAPLRITELDFDTIKANLKTFMQQQAEFTDYDFDGSGLSVLLDVLAYNTHYNAFYMNMLANEMFIDSAVLRQSVVSHAKLLGYTPRSRVASQATINVSFQEVGGGSNSAMTIPKFTKFTAAPKDGKSYTFVTTDQLVVSKNNAGYFNFDNVQIKEGNPASYVYTYVEATNAKQIFALPDVGIDTSTLIVQVQKSVDNNSLETFELAEDATEVTSDAAVYYLEENRLGKYQIYFGDDVIGKALENGNLVIVSYVITSGDAANGIKTFKLSDNIMPGAGVTITLVTESSAGNIEETIDQIKFTAPKSFIAQNRAVTKNDYISLINRNYPYFDSVAVWGGEESSPPVYGKIFFSLKPRGNYEITVSEVQYIKDFVIKPISVLTVTPEYVEADYNYMNFIIDVVYDPRQTSLTAGGIQAAVRTAVTDFADTYLNTFNNDFKMSKLIRAIDDADSSIENNSVRVLIEKRFRPVLNTAKSYKIDFHVPLKRGTAIDRLYSEPSFGYVDAIGKDRVAFIEEIPQSFTGIESIEVLATGAGYTETPTVVIDGDGSGAKAKALIVNGKLKSVTVTAAGTGYSSAVVRVTKSKQNEGTGAELSAVLQGKRGTLRLYYLDTNNIKRVINPNIGTIYYDAGYIQINSFAPTSVDDPFGTMTFKAQPNTNVFSTKRNAILTLDDSDPAAIDIRISTVAR